MPRRIRRSTSAYALSKPTTQLTRMVLLLFVLGMMYARARDPQTWRWLAADDAAGAERPVAAAGGNAAKPSDKETIVPGPTDLDPEEAAEITRLFEAVSDRSFHVDKPEMPAYWRLFKWARAQSFAELEARAQRDPIYTQIWDQPEKYRGQLFRLRLHIKRILEYEAPEKNSAGVKTVFEFWGWTDESKSFPYVVLSSELPAGMSLGGDVSEEGVFVGYLLKKMPYTAFDKPRASPLLVGRMKAVNKPRNPGAASSGFGAWFWPAGTALVLLIAGVAWRARRRDPLPVSRAVVGEETVEDWLTQPKSEGPPMIPVVVPPQADDVPN